MRVGTTATREGHQIFTNQLTRFAGRAGDARITALIDDVRGPLRVAVHGRDGVGRSTVSAALAGAGIIYWVFASLYWALMQASKRQATIGKALCGLKVGGPDGERFSVARSLAREVGSHGIVVNSVAPGYLRTEMSHGLDAAQLDQIVRRTPAGRLGEPADVARAVQFLASPDNDYLTGHVLVLDRGLTA